MMDLSSRKRLITLLGVLTLLIADSSALAPTPPNRSFLKDRNARAAANSVTRRAATSTTPASTTLPDVVQKLRPNSADGTTEIEDFIAKEDLRLKEKAPSLSKIRRMLPPDAFEIDTPTSLMYFGLDLAFVAASLTGLYTVVTSDLYRSLPFYEQAPMVAPLQVLSGFAMWCMWCIGHDAGHGTVSQSKTISRIVGEIAHSVVCLTPYVPWQKSHLKHHLNHNHLDRDYSHQWFIREEKDDLPLAFKASYWTRNFQLPILYLVYLLAGVPDGGHVYFYGRMWENESTEEKINAAWSSLISIATATGLWHLMGTADFAVTIMAPWLVCSFWLFMVTYLQHHSDDGKLYTDDTWTFVEGGFQTVDRDYGKWVNRMSHHMMDGHVVHHLFFAKVPHYKLEDATIALQKGLEESGKIDLYKRIDTPDYTQEIIKQFDENWFFINEAQVVRE